MDTLKEETRGRRSWDRESNLSSASGLSQVLKKINASVLCLLCFVFVFFCFFKITAMWFESLLSPWCVFAVALLLCCVPC